MLENQLSPRLLGKTVGIHPLFELLALVAGAQLAGIAGAIFAPIAIGLLQAFFRAGWATWRANHPEEFPAEDEEQKLEREQRSLQFLIEAVRYVFLAI